MQRKSIKSNSPSLRDIAFEELKKAIDAYNKTSQRAVVRGVSKTKQVEEKQLLRKHLSAYKNLLSARANFKKSCLPKNFKQNRFPLEKSEYLLGAGTDQYTARTFLNKIPVQIIQPWGPQVYGGFDFLGPAPQSLMDCIDPPTLHFGIWGPLQEEPLFPGGFGGGDIVYGIDIEHSDIIRLDLSASIKCGGIAYIGSDYYGAYVEFVSNIYVAQYRGIGKSASEIWSEYWNYTPYRSGQAFPSSSFEAGNPDVVRTDTPGIVTLNSINPVFCANICDVMPSDSFILFYDYTVNTFDAVIDCAIIDWTDTGHFVLYPPSAVEHALSPHFVGVITTAQYRILVDTGDRKNAGTDADVFLTIYGIGIRSDEFQLISVDPLVNPFERNSTSEFNVVLRELGSLESVRVRHDNQGSEPGWFLEKITIQNLTTWQTSVFPCFEWLATDKGDGLIDRVLQHE
jgi:hypothetical protein